MVQQVALTDMAGVLTEGDQDTHTHWDNAT